MGIERTIGKEAVRFIKKDPSKLKLVAGLYALSFLDPRAGKLARAQYFFLRHMDDLLDGEMEVGGNPIDYAMKLRDQIETGRFDPNLPIAQLVTYALPILERRAREDDDPREEFKKEIDGLMDDYFRRTKRKTSTQEELEEVYRATFDPALNLFLIGFRSQLRAVDIPDYSSSLGRLYSVRDLDKDWALGIFNIPIEILEKAGLSSFSSFGEIQSNKTVLDWLQEEINEGKKGLAVARRRIENSREPLTRRVLGGLLHSAQKIEVSNF